MKRRPGFTLIELLVSIALSIIMLSAIYFSLTAALESWDFTRDELALQQVVGDLVTELMSGTDFNPALRSALEVDRAGETEVRFVVPWTEEQTVGSGQRSFQLSRSIKPGTGLPTAELKLPESNAFRPVPISWEDSSRWTGRPRVRSAFDLVPGSTIRFSYHPDPERVPEAWVTYRWDPDLQRIFREGAGGTQPLGENPFGVVISNCRFRYYDSLNHPVAENGDLLESELLLVTAVEMRMTGRLGPHELTLMGMGMLRNSPKQSGLLILRQDLHAPVPDSHDVKVLTLMNLTGIEDGDELQLELRPPSGRTWRVTLRFERMGQARPLIGQVVLEYPPGNVIFTDRPRTPAEDGLNLLTLGPGGRYDYDDDLDVEDAVFLQGDPVMLTVTKMDIQGAAIFVQP